MSTRETLLLCLALGVCAAQPVLADTVVLKDGRVITGRVIERGDRVFIEMPLGGTSVERNQVVRIEGADGTTASPGKEEQPQPVEDVVILRDGRVLHGDVRISDDGSEVIVGMGERGEVRHPRYAVAVIKRRDGSEEVSPSGEDNTELKATLDRRVKQLSDPSQAIRAEARRELLAIGPFARSYLTKLGADHSELVPILQQLDVLEAYRKVLPPRVEEKIPNLAERLVAPGEEGAPQREAALKAIVLEAPDDAGPVLLHAVGTDSSSRIKAYCISQLASLRRFSELAQVLKLTDGPLRLAAAFALGDAGLYVGVPILIEALKLTSPQAADIREAAITKLRDYTGQHFGFRNKASADERAKAIEKWETWWDENGDKLVRDSMKQVAPDLPGGHVTPEETKQAQEVWGQATRLLGQVMDEEQEGDQDPNSRRQRLERVLDLLAQALSLDPGLSSARMSRAVLLYEEFARYDEARKELNLIIVRAKHDDGDPAAAKKFANYHLGKIALLQQDWEKATMRFTQALNYDTQYVEAHVGQGDAYFQLALGVNGGGSQPEEQRRSSLESARLAYRNALSALGKREESLHELMRELVTDAPSELEEGRVLQSVRRSTRELDQQKASLYFKLGRVNGGLQDDARALEAYRTALRLEPDNKDYQQAVKLWDQGN